MAEVKNRPAAGKATALNGTARKVARPAAQSDALPHPGDTVFPAAGRELFDTVVGQIRWHMEQIEVQLRCINRHTELSLNETVRDARAIWALADLLGRAVGQEGGAE